MGFVPGMMLGMMHVLTLVAVKTSCFYILMHSNIPGDKVKRRCDWCRHVLQMSATAMLAGIEARLEEVIAAAAMLPPETVQAAERAREQERRRVRDKVAKCMANNQGRARARKRRM